MNAVLAMREEVRDAAAMVRVLLKEWVAYRKGWSPHIGYPGAVPWIERFDAGVDGWTDGDAYDSKIRAIQMRHVDEAIRDLAADYQHAIFVVYLNEIGPAVWRSSRKPMAEIRALCADAERRLVTALRSRDVVV